MKQKFYLAIVVMLITSSAFTFVKDAQNWKIKDDYKVAIHTSKFDGIFKGLKAEIKFNEASLTDSKVIATIDAATINTGNGMRNKHAKQGLDAVNFSTIKFESTSIIKVGTSYEALGKLTIKDITKDIKLPFTFTKTTDGGIFEGQFSVKPLDYNVKKSGTPEIININLNVPVTK